MESANAKKAGVLFAVALLTFLLSAGNVIGSSDEHKSKASKAMATKPRAEKEYEYPKFFVTPPPFSEGIFPCSQCHAEMEPNLQRRELYFHTEIQEIFDHAADQRWCLDCHNPNNRDVLRLASGNLVTFETSYRLCGQCHGTIFRDWKAGIHGKRTGEWNGKKTYRLCVQCHNPHSPKFRPLHPLPAPVDPHEFKFIKNMDPGDVPSNPLGNIGIN